MLAGVDRELLDELLDTLDGRARYAVEARFGLLDGETQELPRGRRGPRRHRRGRPPARQAGRGRPARRRRPDPGRLSPPTGSGLPSPAAPIRPPQPCPPELRRPFRVTGPSAPVALDAPADRRGTALRVGRPAGHAGAMARPWSPSSWRGFPAAQQPVWPDESDLDRAIKQIGTYPPLVFAGEARALQASLGAGRGGQRLPPPGR